MKRIQTVGMIVSLLAVLTACSENDSAISATVAPTTTTTVAPTTTTTTTTTVAPTTTIETHDGPWIESELVYAARISDGAAITAIIHFPANPEGAPIVIGGPQYLVEEGMIVVDYGDDDHLEDDDDDPDDGPGGPEGMVVDSAGARENAESEACLIRLVRERVSELGNDDPIVVLSGVSLGGGTAVMVALFGATLDERWEEFEAAGGPPQYWECEVTDRSTHVDAVIGMAGTYDLHMPIIDGTYGRAYQQEHNPEMQEFLASVIGANPDLKVRLIHGTADDIPVAYAEEFVEVLADAGYDAQLITWGGGHEGAPKHLYLPAIKEVLGR